MNMYHQRHPEVSNLQLNCLKYVFYLTISQFQCLTSRRYSCEKARQKNSFLISLRKVQNLVPLACFLFGSDQPELNNYCPFSPGIYLHLSPPSMNLWDMWDFNPWWYFILIYPLSAPLSKVRLPQYTQTPHLLEISKKTQGLYLYIC